MKSISKVFFILVFSALCVTTAFNNCAPKFSPESPFLPTASIPFSTEPNVNGQCGSALNTCTSGTLKNTADSSSHYLWQCTGSGQTGTNASCSILASSIPVVAQCSPSINSCIAGTYSDLPDQATQFVWACLGAGSGSNAVCSANKPPTALRVNGECGQNVNTCAKGLPVDVDDTTTTYRWACNGLNEGTSITCQVNKTTQPSIYSGVCAATLNNCTSGIFEDVTDTATHNLWKCNGNNGTSGTCSIAKPVTPNCTVSVGALAHVNESVRFVFTAPAGVTIPNPAILKTSGTKSTLLGGGTYYDENGTEYTVDPNNVTIVNTGGNVAGRYSRSFVILNPSTRQEICKTNTVTSTFTPRCGLSIDHNVGTADEAFVWSIQTPVTGEPALGGTPNNLVLYGTKTVNGVNDPSGAENGTFSMAVNLFPFTYAPNPDPNYPGVYQRYYILRDSAGNQLCKSNTIQVTVNPGAAPPPNTGSEGGDGGGN